MAELVIGCLKESPNLSQNPSKPLSILMNRSFNEAIFPEAWKVANVIPNFIQESQVALRRSPEFCLKLTYRYL